MQHIWTAVRFIIDDLQIAVENFINFQGNERKKRLEESVKPVVPGFSVVLGVSLLERLVTEIISKTPHSGASKDRSIPSVGKLDIWQNHLDLDPKWYGWNELGNFVRLRHCFAHEFGRVLKAQRIHLEEFQDKLRRSEILDENGDKIPAYYEIINNEVVLKAEALHYFRKLCANFLMLLEKSGYSY